MFSKNKAFISFSILFILGILINNIFFNFYLSFLVLLIVVILFLNFYLYTKKNLYIILLAILGLFSGILVSSYEISKINNNLIVLDKYFNNKGELILEIKDLYKIKEFENQYLAKIKKFNNKNIDLDINGIITISGKFNLKKGDLLKTNSKINKIITNFKSDRITNISDFSYDKYLYSKKIYFTSIVYNYENIGKIEQPKLYVYIDNFREKFLEILNNIYPKEEASFLGGLLIGAKENLSNELKLDFNNSGLTHLITVSGFNITILIIFLGYLFGYFPLILRIIFTISSIVLFTIIVGDTAPVIRASIMGILGYLITISGRKTDVLSVILLSSCIMLFFSPLILNYDVSFQLSFLAVLGIVYLSDFFKKVFKFMPEFLAIRESFIMTMSALIMTIPIMLFNFGQLSIISPLTNVLVTWTIPITMFFGFLSIIAYYLSSILGLGIGYFNWIFLKFDILIVHFFGGLEFSVIKTDFFGIYKGYLEVLYFIILFFVIVYFKVDKNKKPF